MEYFILNNDEKQGPFDLIAIIKKIKTGNITPQTLISTQEGQPFVEAGSIPDLASLISEHANPSMGNVVDSHKVNMTLKASFFEGLELWIRRILDYTLIAGLIMAAGYGVEYAFKSITPAGSIIPSYFATVLIMTLFFEFSYYVLETKRSQRIDFRETLPIVKRTFLPFLGISAVLSLFVLAFAINPPLGLLFTFGITIILTYLIFMPFIATDSNIKMLPAAKLSIQRVKSLGGDNFGVLLAIISINLFAAILPGLLQENLLGIGLFISLPVTISALAYTYDQIFV